MSQTEAAARFRPGDPVHVRFADPPGHIRTPWYIRGQTGVVERICGSFASSGGWFAR